ncbi:MAG TPA: DUF1343 domain-containing protein [Gemmatimonadales bacterium]|nr:DUF1343 domain-containing protein [Gemmatimonadales bacterium]
MHRTLALLGGIGASLVTACGSGSVADVPPVPAEEINVRPGIDVLLADSIHLVRGRRVGLVTNQTGVDTAGVSDVELLRAAEVQLVALFSPEHGFRGAAAPGEAVATTRDSATGLPIYSLYGSTSSPTDRMLRGVDLLIVDLQDVGARYYTYISTAIEVMRAGARRDIPVMILDRPNPLGGAMQGGVLDTAFASFIGRLRVPMRHGLTMGEMARLANDDLQIGSTLIVVPASGWKRSLTFDEVGLPFVPPSPNLKTLESLFHYPGTCLFEGTNLSVGRGSSAPFEQIGAPWLHSARVLEILEADKPSGVDFTAVAFTPESPGDGKYADTLVVGIRLKVSDKGAYDPTLTAVHLLSAIRQAHPDRFRWIPAHFDRLAGTDRLREALSRGTDPTIVTSSWGEEVHAFSKRVQPYLIAAYE